MPNIFGQVYNI